MQILAATNRNLLTEVEKGRFRADLFYRLNVVALHVPPLRDRRQDIRYLVAAFVRDAAIRMRKPIEGLTPGAEQLLATVPWEGNVRELRNVIERACILCDGRFISEREISQGAGQRMASNRAAVLEDGAGSRLEVLAREHILRELERARGNKQAAARALDISRRALYRQLAKMRRRASTGAHGG